VANNINRWLKVDNDDAWITLVITMVGVVSAGFAAGFLLLCVAFGRPVRWWLALTA